MIELISDIGGGKTTLTRGIARGAGSWDTVASPTFTVSKQYSSPSLTIHHFDFYRLQEVGLMAHELHDMLDDPNGVVVVEWGEIVRGVLPAERATITFTKTTDGGRELRCTFPPSLEYLFV